MTIDRDHYFTVHAESAGSVAAKDKEHRLFVSCIEEAYIDRANVWVKRPIAPFGWRVFIDNKLLTRLIGGNARFVKHVTKINGRKFYDFTADHVQADIAYMVNYTPHNKNMKQVRERNQKVIDMLWEMSRGNFEQTKEKE